jgi:hypothetical protein
MDRGEVLRRVRKFFQPLEKKCLDLYTTDELLKIDGILVEHWPKGRGKQHRSPQDTDICPTCNEERIISGFYVHGKNGYKVPISLRETCHKCGEPCGCFPTDWCQTQFTQLCQACGKRSCVKHGFVRSKATCEDCFRQCACTSKKNRYALECTVCHKSQCKRHAFDEKQYRETVFEQPVKVCQTCRSICGCTDTNRRKECIICHDNLCTRHAFRSSTFDEKTDTQSDLVCTDCTMAVRAMRKNNG